jgi:NADH:ubiquinone oxidoreductase subunit 5 (subunit L)/multisubunit Na+/H+ antiporter MnhA subunit
MKSRPHDAHHWEAAHESPRSMLIPLFVLAVGSILAGYPFYKVFVAADVESYLSCSSQVTHASPVAPAG